jgi:hypothetical protein
LFFFTQYTVIIVEGIEQLVISCEMPKILIFPRTPYIGINLVFIRRELVVRTQQLSFRSSVG